MKRETEVVGKGREKREGVGRGGRSNGWIFTLTRDKKRSRMQTARECISG